MAMFDLPLDQLRSYRPDVAEPSDFDDFWRQTLAEARSHELGVRIDNADNKLAVLDTYDVTFAGFGGHRISAWLHVPAGTSRPLPTVLHYQGYSGGRGFPHQHTTWAQAGWAHLVMDTRSQGWSVGGGSNTTDPSPEAGLRHTPGLLTVGISSPQSYYYRRVFTDAVRMIEVAGATGLTDPDKVIATGGSQGGGIALAAAGLAPMAGLALAGVAPDVPFLCHFRRALQLTDELPYGEITRYLAGWRDQAEPVHRTLSYFDGVNLARRASAPSLFSVALMDPVCPPSTVFAAYNAYGERSGASKDINVYPYNQHEGGGAYQVEAQLEWFATRFASR
ncbi:MAG TPA: acetylxylan esterase [Propionibacteriaceae bacterium]